MTRRKAAWIRLFVMRHSLAEVFKIWARCDLWVPVTNLVEQDVFRFSDTFLGVFGSRCFQNSLDFLVFPSETVFPKPAYGSVPFCETPF